MLPSWQPSWGKGACKFLDNDTVSPRNVVSWTECVKSNETDIATDFEISIIIIKTLFNQDDYLTTANLPLGPQTPNQIQEDIIAKQLWEEQLL